MINTLYKTFQKWSEKGSVYILSDLHLGDPDCKLMDKNWISPNEQIELINSVVHRDDTFICLGDVGNPEYAKKIKAGYKVLILGNHDKRKDYKDIFDEIYDGALFISSKILLSHEPVYGLNWCLNIHGHDHCGCKDMGDNRLNLAANVCGYKPVSLAKLIKTGGISDIKDIHRQAIDKQIEKRKERCEEKCNIEEECTDEEVDDDAPLRLTEWACLALVLKDYGVYIDEIPGRIGKHIVEDFMADMCKQGYVARVS